MSVSPLQTYSTTSSHCHYLSINKNLILLKSPAKLKWIWVGQGFWLFLNSALFLILHYWNWMSLYYRFLQMTSYSSRFTFKYLNKYYFHNLFYQYFLNDKDYFLDNPSVWITTPILYVPNSRMSLVIHGWMYLSPTRWLHS